MTLQLIITKRWFFWPAVFLIMILGGLRLIRDADSAEHHDGRITGQERAARWLVKHATRVSLR